MSLITRTARDINSRGWDPFPEWGRVDIANALGVQAPSTAPAPPPTSQPVAPGRDRTAPAVNISAPANNSLVSTLVPIDVTATDDVGVKAVELAVDGLVTARDPAPPFSFIWDSATVSSGRHTLSASAYDAAGHRKTSKTIRVQVVR